MGEITTFLGDSEKGASAYSITSLAIGMALGVLLGLLQFPLPGGGHFALGLGTQVMVTRRVILNPDDAMEAERPAWRWFR